LLTFITNIKTGLIGDKFMSNISRISVIVFAVAVVFVFYNKRTTKDTPIKEQVLQEVVKNEDQQEKLGQEKSEEVIEVRSEPENKLPTIQESQNVRGYKIESDDMVLGNKDAKIVFVEYFSPTCPHCVVYHRRVFPEIRKKYIETGKIAYVMREFVNNKQDFDASILARCDGSLDSYTKFIQVLLERQDQWVFNKNYREILTNIAGLGGVSAEKYAACLNSSSIIATVVGNTKLISKESKFMGTPSFFIDGKQFTAPYTLEDLSKAIDEALR
jgi:protein-disulfide isomerase